ncbi:MAG: dTDP-4-dehydrorhamnose reductase [Mycobacterium sp.]
MRVLITGAGGQVGLDLMEVFSTASAGASDRAVVVGTDHRRLDVSDRDAVHEAFRCVGPDLVIHAAAWTAVDACEGDPDRAFLVNSLGTRHVAEAARGCRAHLCYISTDYVFDGRAGQPYKEWDTPNPLSVYGRCKLGGEMELDPGSTIVRTSWVCGLHGNNMVKTVLGMAKQEGPLRFVDDQHGCPTFSSDLAVALRGLAMDRRPGIFHVTNQGPTTWFKLARAVLGAAGADPSRVEPMRTSELSPPRPAPRPAYSVLDNAALRLGGLPLLPDWHESLERLVGELR